MSDRGFIARNRDLIAHWAIFLGILALFVLAAQFAGTLVNRRFSEFTAQALGFFMGLLTERSEVIGRAVSCSVCYFEIIGECTAYYPLAILVSAILAYPCRMRERLLGVVLGVPTLLLINQVRLISLCYVDRSLKQHFDTIHVVVWQPLIVFFTVLIWVVWISFFVRDDEAGALRKVSGFVLRFVLWFAAGLLVYTIVLPAYQPLVLAGSNLVTQNLEPRLRCEIDAYGTWQYFEIRGVWNRPWTRWDPINAHLFLLGLALLPALIMATPAPLATRLRRTAIGLVLLYVVQVLAVVVLVRTTHCLRVVPGTWHCLVLLRAAFTSGQLSAAALWALLTWRFWLPARNSVR